MVLSNQVNGFADFDKQHRGVKRRYLNGHIAWLLSLSAGEAFYLDLLTVDDGHGLGGAGSQLRHSRPAPNPGSTGLHLLAMGRAIHGEAKRSQQPAGPLPHNAVDIGVVNGMVALPTDTRHEAGVT